MKRCIAILATVLVASSVAESRADTTPDPFTLPTYTDAPYGSEITESIQITGIDAPAAVTITGGEYALDCNQATGFVTTPGTVTNGRSICVRHFTSMTPGSVVQTTITVGGVSATLKSTVTTAPLDSLPSPFAFRPQSNLLPGGTYRACTSSFNPPLNSGLTISTTNAQWIHPFNGLMQSAPGLIPPFQTVCMQYTAPATFDTPFTAVMTVTGVNNGVPGTTSATLDGRTIANGRMDTAFGPNGVRTYHFGSNTDSIWALIQQPDGKLLGAGNGGGPNGDRSDAILVRLLPDGTGDQAFGDHAAVFPDASVTSFDASTSTAVALAPDGKIYWVVDAGNAATPTQTFDVLYRLNTDGTLDTTFGFGGSISSTNTPSQSVAIQPEGKVIVAGRSGAGGSLIRLLRFNTENAAGSNVVDSTFGLGTGQTSALVGSSPNNGFTGVGFTTEPGGNPSKIVQVAGYPDPAKGICLSYQCESITVLRWTHAGVLDDTFGCTSPPCSGRIDHSFTPYNNLPRQIRVQPDNKIVIVFRRQSSLPNQQGGVDFAIARLNPDGTKDLGFGTNGEAVLDVRGYGASVDNVNDLYLYPDGRILVAGRSRGLINNLVTPPANDSGNSDDIVLARFLANGQLDTAFADQGMLLVPFSYRKEIALALAVDSQGRASIAGQVTVDPNTGQSDALFARFIIDPVADLVPDAFSFNAAANVQPGATVTSSTITVQGITAPTSIAVSSGSSYSIGCTGTFTSTTATIVNGQTVCVRHVAPLALNAVTTTSLTIGGVSGSFASTTVAALTPGQDFDNDGIPNEVEALENKNPFVRDNDVFLGDRLFTMQQYRDFLNREGDPAGIQGWVNFIGAGTYTRLQVIDAFLSSQEFAGFVAPVVRLYFATFLRVPDYAGLVFNAGLVRAGTVTVVQLADFFTVSPEFQATYGALNDTQFVTLLYNNVLGRAPDAAGLAGWVGLLQSGYTRGQVLVGFSDSPEYQANSANKVFVTMMYAGMLHRTPEPNGFNGWVAFLDAGTYTRTQVINGFFLSIEYHNRFLP